MRIPKCRDIRARSLRLCHDRVAHKLSLHPCRLHQIRFKRQKREHLVGKLCKLRCTLGPPSPNRRRNIMYRSNCRIGRAHVFPHTLAKIRAVDGQQDIRFKRKRRCHSLVLAPQQRAVLWQNFRQPHYTQLIHRKNRRQPFGLHQWSAHPSEFNVRQEALEPRHHGFAELVSRRFPRNDKDTPHTSHKNSPASLSVSITFG